jgi:hypothetical protein
MAKAFSGRLYGMISVGNESSTDGLFLQLQDLSVLTAAGFRAKPVSCGIRNPESTSNSLHFSDNLYKTVVQNNSDIL